MKKIALFFVLSVMLPLQAQAVELWKEGQHYKVLDMPASKKPEIRE
jgi:thiol:disulfide interchange protein DsbA